MKTHMKKNHNSPEHRPSRLPDGSPLDFAPDNEQGVVFLFSHLARKKYGLRVERIQTGFPDCIAYQGTKRIRIEFEFKSKNFKTHRHVAKDCDWIVCWEHNWPDVPDNVQVEERQRLRRLDYDSTGGVSCRRLGFHNIAICNHDIAICD